MHTIQDLIWHLESGARIIVVIVAGRKTMALELQRQEDGTIGVSLAEDIDHVTLGFRQPSSSGGSYVPTC